MAVGIVKLHSNGCPAKDGARCRCKAGYEAWVYLPRERRKVRKTFRREAEAKSWRSDAAAALNRGALQATSRDRRPLIEALANFVGGMRSGAIRPKGRLAYKPNTVRSYETALQRHISSSGLGALGVSEVRRRDIQAFADDLLATGLSPGTVSNVLNPVQAFYRRAVNRDELAYNPAEGIDLPTQRAGRPKRIAPAEEAARLLAALPEDDRSLWATAFYAGLRRGELQALRVVDVDLGASLIRVERGWDQYEGAIEPKSPSARRTIPLLAVLRDYLDEYLLRSGRQDDDLVFGRTSADPFVASTIDNRAQGCWVAGSLEPITLHECRHTFASLLIDAGANAKAIQSFMGHSKVQTTFDTYGHLMPGSHDEVRQRMDLYLQSALETRAGASSDAGTNMARL